MSDAGARTDPAQRAKWIVAVLLGLAIAALSVALLVRPTIVDDPRLVVQKSTSGTIKAVFLGGSLTDSLFASTEEAGYRPQVVAELDAPVDESRGNVTSGRVAAAVTTAKVPPDTNLVVVELGSGDVWKITGEELMGQYGDLMAEVRKSAPQAAIVCLGVWGDKVASSTYDRSIRVPCERVGGHFLSLADLFVTAGMRGPAGAAAYGGTKDGFHPNDEGYSAIARLILDDLRVE